MHFRLCESLFIKKALLLLIINLDIEDYFSLLLFGDITFYE